MKFLYILSKKCFCFGLLMLGFFSISTQSVQAQDNFQDHIFTIYGLSVDITASNAREARSLALTKAQVSGFNLLLRKISIEDRLAEARPLSSNEVSNHVSGIEVHNERTSARRYIATLDISFNKAKVLQYLGMNNLPYTELTGGPLLLLPIYEYGGVAALFEDDNPWLNALSKADIENHLFKYKLAEGNFEDQLLVGNLSALNNNQQDFQARSSKLNSKYGTSDLLLARAWWGSSDENGLKNLHFSYSRGLSTQEKSGMIVAHESYSQEHMFIMAAQAIFNRMDISWRQQTLTSFGAFNELEVRVSAQNAVQWVDIIERLKATPIVRTIEVDKVAVPVSQITIIYSGVFEQLRLVLQGVNLNLVEDFDGWYLEKSTN